MSPHVGSLPILILSLTTSIFLIYTGHMHVIHWTIILFAKGTVDRAEVH